MKLLHNWKNRRALKRLAPDYFKYFKQNNLVEYALERLNDGWTAHQAVMLQHIPTSQVSQYGLSLVYFLVKEFKYDSNSLDKLNVSNTKTLCQSIMEHQTKLTGSHKIKMWDYSFVKSRVEAFNKNGY